jgi:IMP dehydrogenase/GMP reductase
MRNGKINLGLTFDDVLLIPQRTPVKSRSEVDLSTRLVGDLFLSLPVVSANTPFCTERRMAIGMALAGGIGVVHRMCSPQQEQAHVRAVKKHRFSEHEHPHATCDVHGRLAVGAAVGVKNDYLIRARMAVDAGADILVVDIAHGHADQCMDAVAFFKKEFPRIPLVAGNVATALGVRDLVAAGADAVKIGIGPGSICTTRIVTGAGVPQLSAMLACAEEAKKHNIPIIADGGMRTSGDIVKALAAGASAVMLGGMLAGVDESAAILIQKDGRSYKATTGFVTLGVGLTFKHLAGERISRREFEDYVPEGIEATYEHRGPLAPFLKQIAGGLRSGFSYCGATCLEQLWEHAEFMRITNAALAESQPHARSRCNASPPDYASKFVTETDDTTLKISGEAS